MGIDAERRIAALSEVPTDSTLLFRVAERTPDRSTDSASDGRANASGSEQEAILVATRAESGEQLEVACWLNVCQHFTHIKLDKGSGAAMRNGELVCENHGAYFEADSGLCTYGPCEGATLAALDVTVEDEAVYLIDDDYEFVGRGPVETDDDLTSTSNVEF
ncbi:Rieske (2Fe-2S) protein [Natrialba asiatica]|uniref:Rieske iron sulfur-like protein n=1 Tax=Natrialba asiatica (strain ATCC 700177 / DSM 12278 / JCM 9576 / FERM P-10747 / NBRC 102637 / 172P1) TaxID=29540 RepID=M0AN29_NATA1|nr:Rieske 2Fe-2S domain-containing protein [Natrialba asiatica]ELY98793.1 Rieske iron sulfur-like protein [Natrialba asiatica DSM 12278]